jgi:preprotein translocase SecE subunit
MNPGEYVKEVKNEMSHVVFPTKKKTALFTLLVIIFSLGVALALGLFDFVFKIGLEKLLNF